MMHTLDRQCLHQLENIEHNLVVSHGGHPLNRIEPDCLINDLLG
jgi:hypothetical protein